MQPNASSAFFFSGCESPALLCALLRCRVEVKPQLRDSINSLSRNSAVRDPGLLHHAFQLFANKKEREKEGGGGGGGGGGLGGERRLGGPGRSKYKRVDSLRQLAISIYASSARQDLNGFCRGLSKHVRSH